MTPSAGEVWIADRGDDQRGLVFVVSDDRFHQLAARAVIAPVVPQLPPPARPWHVATADGRVIVVNRLGTTPLERLLERDSVLPYDTLRRVRHAVRAIVG